MFAIVHSLQKGGANLLKGINSPQFTWKRPIVTNATFFSKSFSQQNNTYKREAKEESEENEEVIYTESKDNIESSEDDSRPLDPNNPKDREILEWEKKQRFLSLRTLARDVNLAKNMIKEYKEPMELPKVEKNLVEDENEIWSENGHLRIRELDPKYKPTISPYDQGGPPPCYLCGLRRDDPYVLDAMVFCSLFRTYRSF
jgi:hypothetical protein